MTLSIDKVLIEQIVREVIKSLYVASSESLYQKPCLLLVHGENRGKEEIDKVTADLQAKWHVIVMSLHTPDILATTSDVKHMVLMDVDQDTLIRGAYGFTDTTPSELLANALNNGIPVTLIPSKSLAWILQPKELEDGLPEPAMRYRQHIRKHKDILTSFGATMARLSELQISSVAKSRIANQEDVSNEKTMYFDPKVLTQRDVQVTDVTTIVVSRLTIVTPLARDTARDKGVTILVKES